MKNSGIFSSCVGDCTFLACVFFFHILADRHIHTQFISHDSCSLVCTLRGCIRHVFLVLNVLPLLWLKRWWVSACVPMIEP